MGLCLLNDFSLFSQFLLDKGELGCLTSVSQLFSLFSLSGMGVCLLYDFSLFSPFSLKKVALGWLTSVS